MPNAETVVPWKVSLFLSGFKSISPKEVTVKGMAQLDKLFLRPSTRPNDFNKRMLPCWSPSLYQPGKTRKNGNVSHLSALVYDFDSPTVVPADVANRMVFL